MTGRWIGRGLCLTGRVRSVLSVCPCFGSQIGRGGASGHDRPDASGRCESLLDSNRTLALWRPVRLAACPVAVLLERCSGLTSASGPLRDQRVRSARLQQFQLTNGYIRRGTSINTRWPAQGSNSCTL
jgi:hypothetical protein